MQTLLRVKKEMQSEKVPTQNHGKEHLKTLLFYYRRNSVVRSLIISIGIFHVFFVG